MMYDCNCIYTFYSIRPKNDTSFAYELSKANASNEMFAASKRSMDRNTDIKTYGNRLANIPVDERKSILSGVTVFNALCVTCHGPGGKGMAVAGTSNLAAPPLTGIKKNERRQITSCEIIITWLIRTC